MQYENPEKGHRRGILKTKMTIIIREIVENKEATLVCIKFLFPFGAGEEIEQKGVEALEIADPLNLS